MGTAVLTWYFPAFCYILTLVLNVNNAPLVTFLIISAEKIAGTSRAERNHRCHRKGQEGLLVWTSEHHAKLPIIVGPYQES